MSDMSDMSDTSEASHEPSASSSEKDASCQTEGQTQNNNQHKQVTEQEEHSIDTATGKSAPANISSERVKKIFTDIAWDYERFNKYSSFGQISQLA